MNSFKKDLKKKDKLNCFYIHDTINFILYKYIEGEFIFIINEV